MEEYNNFNQFNNYQNPAMMDEQRETFSQYVASVFTTMFIGLLVTAGISWLIYRNIMSGGFFFRMLIQGGNIAVFAPVVLQLVLTIVFMTGLRKFSLTTVSILFYGYAALTGVSFSIIFLAYDIGTITLAFVYTAVMFGVCVFAGKVLKVDLSRFRNILFSALIVLVLASAGAFFIPALRDSLFLTYAGIVLFAVYTTYDMQRLKHYYYAGDFEGTEMSKKYGIYGAFQLYLDFINLFLRILQLLSRSSSKD